MKEPNDLIAPVAKWIGDQRNAREATFTITVERGVLSVSHTETAPLDTPDKVAAAAQAVGGWVEKQAGAALARYVLRYESGKLTLTTYEESQPAGLPEK